MMQEQHENSFIEKNRHRIWFKNRLQILKEGVPYLISADGWIYNTSDQSKIERWFWISEERMVDGKFLIRPSRNLFEILESYLRLEEYILNCYEKQKQIISDFLSENNLDVENNIYVFDHQELFSLKDNSIRVLEIKKVDYNNRIYCEERGLEIPNFFHSMERRARRDLTPPKNINIANKRHYSLTGIMVDDSEIVKRICFYKERAYSLQKKKAHLANIIGFFVADAFPKYRLFHGEEHKKIAFVGDYVVIPAGDLYRYGVYRQKDFLRIENRPLI